MPQQQQSNSFTLFPKWSIVLFSVLCTYFCGALMLSYNLRQVGKGKKALIVVIIHIVVFVVLRAGLKPFAIGSILEYLIPNLIVGLLLAFPVWDYFFTEIEAIKPKSPLVPVIATAIVWAGIIIFILALANR
jgi:hypothetical protein